MADITSVMSLVMSTYSNEPCRICRKLITEDETRHIVFTGYTDVDGKVSRASHGACWKALTAKERAALKAEHERSLQPEGVKP